MPLTANCPECGEQAAASARHLLLADPRDLRRIAKGALIAAVGTAGMPAFFAIAAAIVTLMRAPGERLERIFFGLFAALVAACPLVTGRGLWLLSRSPAGPLPAVFPAPSSTPSSDLALAGRIATVLYAFAASITVVVLAGMILASTPAESLDPIILGFILLTAWYIRTALNFALVRSLLRRMGPSRFLRVSRAPTIIAALAAGISGLLAVVFVPLTHGLRIDPGNTVAFLVLAATWLVVGLAVAFILLLFVTLLIVSARMRRLARRASALALTPSPASLESHVEAT